MKSLSKVDTRTILRDYFGDDSRTITTKGTYAIEALCDEMRVPIQTFCQWWAFTWPPGKIVDNFLCSEKTMAAFMAWVMEEKQFAKTTVKLEVDAFMAAERANRDNPLRLFRNPVRDVSPLVQYIMGCYFSVPSEVEWARRKAMRQLLEKPWYRDGLGDLAKYIPKEDDNGLS